MFILVGLIVTTNAKSFDEYPISTINHNYDSSFHLISQITKGTDSKSSPNSHSKIVHADADPVMVNSPPPIPSSGYQDIVIPPDANFPNHIHFKPSQLSILIGTTITWSNHDTVNHFIHVYSVNSSYSSFPLANGDKNMSPLGIFSMTFNEPGKYDYFCSLHSFMKGSIIVN